MRHFAGLQLELLSKPLEGGTRLFELGLQLLLHLAEFVGCFPLTQVGLEFRARLLEGLRLTRLDFVEMDNVVAVLGFDGTAGLAHRHAEKRITEGTDEHRLIRPAQIAALVRRARILRILLGELAEVLAGLDLCVDLVRQLLVGRIVLGRGNQDVARMALLGHHVGGLVLVVGRVQLGIGYRHLRRELIEPQFRVLQMGRLGGHVLGLVRLVVGLHGGIVDRRSRKFVGWQLHVTHFALLVLSDCARASSAGVMKSEARMPASSCCRCREVRTSLS